MKLLFVCSGNICRSPMAAGIAEAVGDRIGLPIEAASAGTLGIVGKRADPKAVTVCREIGVDLSTHRSRGLDDALIAWADHVLVMELAHAEHVREFFPQVGDRVRMLGSFGGRAEIADPLGGWTWTFRRSRKEIERAVAAFLKAAAR